MTVVSHVGRRPGSIPIISSNDDFYVERQLCGGHRRLRLDVSDPTVIRLPWDTVTSALRGHLHNTNPSIDYPSDCVFVGDEGRRLSEAPTTHARVDFLEALIQHVNSLQGVGVSFDLSPLRELLQARDALHAIGCCAIVARPNVEDGVLWLQPSQEVRLLHDILLQSGFSLREGGTGGRWLAAKLSRASIDAVSAVGPKFLVAIEGTLQRLRQRCRLLLQAVQALEWRRSVWLCSAHRQRLSPPLPPLLSQL